MWVLGACNGGGGKWGLGGDGGVGQACMVGAQPLVGAPIIQNIQRTRPWGHQKRVQHTQITLGDKFGGRGKGGLVQGM